MFSNENSDIPSKRNIQFQIVCAKLVGKRQAHPTGNSQTTSTIGQNSSLPLRSESEQTQLQESANKTSAVKKGIVKKPISYK